VARTRLYRNGRLEREDFAASEISDLIELPDAAVWLDYCRPSVEDLQTIAEELKLHPLAVEDAVGEHQRPKLDRYRSHLFLNAYSVRLREETGTLQTSEVGVFITPRALVTVRKDEGIDADAVRRRWDESEDLAAHGVTFLLWGLLDVIVDGHFEAVQALDDQIEDLQDLLFDGSPREAEVQRRSFELRKSLVLLRRVVVPMREVVNSVMRRDLHVIDQEMSPYYQDVYDHVLRATEWTEALRDLVTTVLETNLALQGNRMNLVMKKVTSWAAIIAVPTAITGFYGQNVPYPGFSALPRLPALGLAVGSGRALRRRARHGHGHGRRATRHGAPQPGPGRLSAPLRGARAWRRRALRRGRAVPSCARRASRPPSRRARRRRAARRCAAACAAPSRRSRAPSGGRSPSPPSFRWIA
jgi:magnesium transporter